jgi:hypothetical protein
MTGKIMESLLSLRACIGTMNRIEDENDEEDEQRFMESLVLLRTCIGTMNPTGTCERAAD